MIELDFSKISTKQLHVAVEYYKDESYSPCAGFSCGSYGCPLYDHFSCTNFDREQRHQVFKEELERREKMENNKMPELKAGMIVDYEGYGLRLCLPLYSEHRPPIGFYAPNLYGAESDYNKINAIYENRSGYHFKAAFETGVRCLSLIWSKKSDTDLKKEELEKELKELEEDHSKRVSEIRAKLQEL